MAIISTLSNHYKKQLAEGNINFSSNVYKIILTDTSFTFDKDLHATLADVTSNQLSTGNGYTQNNKTLANVSITEDDTNDKASITWDNVTWTASGGSIGGTGAACIYDDTTSDDTIIGCIDFGSDFTIEDGVSFQLQNIQIDLS